VVSRIPRVTPPSSVLIIWLITIGAYIYVE
jgi:hypothetical protein